MLKLGLILLIFPLIFLMASWGIEYSQVSSCIYEGGSFDYLTGECLEAGQGRFISFAQRHPRLVNWCLGLAVSGFLITTWGLYKNK